MPLRHIFCKKFFFRCSQRVNVANIPIVLICKSHKPMSLTKFNIRKRTTSVLISRNYISFFYRRKLVRINRPYPQLGLLASQIYKKTFESKIPPPKIPDVNMINSQRNITTDTQDHEKSYVLCTHAKNKVRATSLIFLHY